MREREEREAGRRPRRWNIADEVREREREKKWERKTRVEIDRGGKCLPRPYL